MEKQPTEGEKKISAKHSSKGLISRIYTKLLKFKINENVIQKWTK